jgi:hypothetical protein
VLEECSCACVSNCDGFFYSEPITIIIGEPDMYIYKGSTINLTCVVKHSPEPPPAIYWTHNSQVSDRHIEYQNNSGSKDKIIYFII